MSIQSLRLVAVGVVACAATWLVSCDSTTGPSNNSIYYVTYQLGAPINRNYSKDLLQCFLAPVLDSVKHANVLLDTLHALVFEADGRCSCGALTPQFFMCTDTLFHPVYSAKDSGSVWLKVNGEQVEAYAHGTLVVDSSSKDSLGYKLKFSGRIKYGTDSVDLTNGIMYAPLRATK